MRKFLLVFALFAGAAAAQQHPSVTLNWTWSQGTGDPATGFHVQRAAQTNGPYTIVGSTVLATTTFLDTTVVVGSTYYYVVTAYNSAGDSTNSNEVVATLPFITPAAPSTLTKVVR